MLRVSALSFHLAIVLSWLNVMTDNWELPLRGLVKRSERLRQKKLSCGEINGSHFFVSAHKSYQVLPQD